MTNFDYKFYWSVFMRRMPYFLVITALVTAIAVTVAFVLPIQYRSQARMLVEPQQIPGDLAQTTVPVNPFEQAQIIQQRLMTRANLLELAERIGLYADEPDMSMGAIVSDIAERIEFIGFTPDVTRAPDTPGATIIGVAFTAPTGELANKGTNALVDLVLEENVRLRTGRATDTLDFFQSEVERLASELELQSERISDFKTENVEALPDSVASRRAQQEREQQRLLALENEESQLKSQRDTLVWVYERTGRTSTIALTPEQETLAALKSELVQQRAVYAPNSPTIRVLEGRIAALEALVAEQPQSGADDPSAPMSELDVELAPIDSRLNAIAQEKELIDETLAALNESIRVTPNNEMVLTGMEREYDSLNEQYQQALNNLAQAQTGQRIETLAKGERFSLIEEPSVPKTPSSPNRLLISAAGVVGGMGMGAGFIFLMELLNRSIRRPMDLTSALGIQPFATVPYIRSPGEVRRKRTIVATVLALIVIAIPVSLFVIHTYYVPLDLFLSGEEEAATASSS